MTFLAPGFLIAAGAVSLGVVVLHFLITQQPKSELLPTVRFVPDVPARSTSLAIKPSDLLLLLLRVLAIMLIGAALAQPQLTPDHKSVARIVAVDASRAVGSMAELTDSAKVYANGASAVIVFDSVSREIPIAAAGDTLNAMASRSPSSRRGSLSPALITSLRTAARIREAADSIELVVVSPFANEQRDAATAQIRSLWPGKITPVKVQSASDTAFANKSVRIEWADSVQSPLWAERTTIDTVGAVRSGEAVMVYPFVRRWQPAADPDSNTSIYARWVDGEPAAFETITPMGCTRSVSIPMPTAGDAILRPDFARFQRLLTEPCGRAHDFAPMPGEVMSMISGPENRASVTDIKPVLTKMTPFVPWLLLAGLVLLLLELLLRHRTETGAARRERTLTAQQSPEPRVKGVAA